MSQQAAEALVGEYGDEYEFLSDCQPELLVRFRPPVFVIS